MDNHNLKQVIEILQKEGYSDDQITKICSDLTIASAQKFYSQAMGIFTKEDLEIISSCKNQDEANLKIKEIYKIRTNKDADIEMQKFLGFFAQGFINEYNKSKKITPMFWPQNT